MKWGVGMAGIAALAIVVIEQSVLGGADQGTGFLPQSSHFSRILNHFSRSLYGQRSD
jgi:hypothetical protein